MVEARPKVVASKSLLATAVNCIGRNNDNVFDFHFRLKAKKRLSKKADAEIENMHCICIYLHFPDDDNHDGLKSHTNYAGSLQR